MGAGIYILTGKIAALAGVWAPLSFLVACVLASFTALSFGELASRYPTSAGEAVYLSAGFGIPRLAQLGGFFVCLAGVTSAATLTLATVGYLADVIAIWKPAAVVGLVLGLGLIATWGIRESVTVAAPVGVPIWSTWRVGCAGEDPTATCGS